MLAIGFWMEFYGASNRSDAIDEVNGFLETAKPVSAAISKKCRRRDCARLEPRRKISRAILTASEAHRIGIIRQIGTPGN